MGADEEKWKRTVCKSKSMIIAKKFDRKFQKLCSAHLKHAGFSANHTPRCSARLILVRYATA